MFGLPTFLLVGAVMFRTGVGFGSVEAWLVILVPTVGGGCVGGYKTTKNNIYKHKSENWGLKDAVTKVHTNNKGGIDPKVIAAIYGEDIPPRKVGGPYFSSLFRAVLLMVVIILAALFSRFLSK